MPKVSEWTGGTTGEAAARAFFILRQVASRFILACGERLANTAMDDGDFLRMLHQTLTKCTLDSSGPVVIIRSCVERAVSSGAMVADFLEDASGFVLPPTVNEFFVTQAYGLAFDGLTSAEVLTEAERRLDVCKGAIRGDQVVDIVVEQFPEHSIREAVAAKVQDYRERGLEVTLEDIRTWVAWKGRRARGGVGREERHPNSKSGATAPRDPGRWGNRTDTPRSGHLESALRRQDSALWRP